MITAKEQAITLGELSTGKLDIIIGTHKLLSEKIKFEDLGLLIIQSVLRVQFLANVLFELGSLPDHYAKNIPDRHA